MAECVLAQIPLRLRNYTVLGGGRRACLRERFVIIFGGLTRKCRSKEQYSYSVEPGLN
jgi:hypothetical protein